MRTEIETFCPVGNAPFETGLMQSDYIIYIIRDLHKLNFAMVT